MTVEPHPKWRAAITALRLVAVAPRGLGGIVLRARAGPARDAFLRTVARDLAASARLHPAMTDAALFGGLDLDATLSTGRAVTRDGLAAHDGPLILPMAERTPPQLAARLARIVDAGRAHPLILLDEAASGDEAVPAVLVDRLAFHVDLDGLSLADIAPVPASAPRAVGLPRAQEPQIAQIARLAEAMGIADLRAAWLAVQAAGAHAALAGRAEVAAEDLEVAAALVLAPRATRLPDAAAEDDAPPADPPDSDGSRPPDPPASSDPGAETSLADRNADQRPDDMMIDAVRALLPEDMLARIASGRQRRALGSGTGDTRASNRRGRPIPSRRGRLDGNARLDLVATLRAAAPWQKARKAATPGRDGLHIRSSDIFLRRYEQKSDRLLIFVVDASGSAAMTRLAEAKGAVELMLASAYARRDHVALIGFRGRDAQVALPPTRSLLRTKRQLTALAGGGATPLADGLRIARETAQAARQRGMTPTLALLTDGRANIALDGTPDRARAGREATEMGTSIAATGTDAIVIDMGPRPEPALEALATTMRAAYFALPRANAQRLSAALTSVLDG